VRAPDALRARIETSRPPRRTRVRRHLELGGALATALAVILLAVVLVSPAGTPGAPSLSQAAALGMLTPTAAAPAPDTAHASSRLAREVEEIYFPNWESIHWRAVGQRTDRINGRLALTVYYEGRGHRIAYTIVSAPALAQPNAPVTTVRGTVERTLTIDGRTAVTWRRAGHTCLLSGQGVPGAVLRALAGWHPGA